MQTVDSLVAVLSILRHRHPTPWYYHEEPHADGHQFADLRSLLEFLAQEGLIEKAPARDEHSGIGARLTPRGLAVCDDPQALERLQRGQSPFPDAISDTVRREYRRVITPWMTYLLMAVSIAVYAYGVWQWYRLPRVPQDPGAVSGEHILEGNYVRLLTSTFYHGGGLHLLMNMIALWSLGAFVERTWGRWRFLMIYLSAAWAGTCTAMAFQPYPVLGASGAVCGMLGAMLIYMLVLSRYLPRPEMRSLWFSLIVNILILTLISLFPGISGLGHLGGGLGGALAALVLLWQRFGGWTGALLGLLALPLVPVGSFVMLQQVRSYGSEAWTKLEDEPSKILGYNRTRNLTNRVSRAYADIVEPLIEQRASRREPAKVKAAQELLHKEIAALRERQQELQWLQLRTPTSRQRIQALQKELQARIDYYVETIRYFERGEQWTREEEAAHEQMWKRVLESIEQVKKAFTPAPQKPD